MVFCTGFLRFTVTMEWTMESQVYQKINLFAIVTSATFGPSNSWSTFIFTRTRFSITWSLTFRQCYITKWCCTVMYNLWFGKKFHYFAHLSYHTHQSFQNFIIQWASKHKYKHFHLNTFTMKIDFHFPRCLINYPVWHILILFSCDRCNKAKNKK